MYENTTRQTLNVWFNFKFRLLAGGILVGLLAGIVVRQKKIILEIPVHPGSSLDGTYIKDFKWPANCLIVSIKRGSSELIPAGDFEIKSGDYLTLLTDEDRASKVRRILQKASAMSLG